MRVDLEEGTRLRYRRHINNHCPNNNCARRTRLMRLRHTIRDRFAARGIPAADQRLVGYTTGAHALDHLVILSIPLFVPIWLEEFQVTTYELGLLVTVMTGLYGVMALPSGILSDRFGADTV